MAAKGNQQLFDQALKAEGVTGPVADLARSIYFQESGGGKNTTTSNAGAVGGMQIIPSTFKSVADKGWDINDPTANARAGIRYVEKMVEAGGGDLRLAAVGYYGGPGAIAKARKGEAVYDKRNPNAPNTLQYADQVLARMGGNPGQVATAGGSEVPAAGGRSPNANALASMGGIPGLLQDATGGDQEGAAPGQGQGNPPAQAAAAPPGADAWQTFLNQMDAEAKAQGLKRAAAQAALTPDALDFTNSVTRQPGVQVAANQPIADSFADWLR